MIYLTVKFKIMRGIIAMILAGCFFWSLEYSLWCLVFAPVLAIALTLLIERREC